ncbi:hypothetical protein [Nostoc sp.]
MQFGLGLPPLFSPVKQLTNFLPSLPPRSQAVTWLTVNASFDLK